VLMTLRRLPIQFGFSNYALDFARLAATLSHVILGARNCR
jgi:hypothetical protein